MTTLITAAIGAVVAVAILWGRPRFALVLWLIMLAAIPTWVAVYNPLYLPIHSIAALLIIIAIGGSEGLKLSAADYYFIVCLFGALLTVPLSHGSGTLWASIVVQWGFAFLVARVLIPAAGICFAANAIALVMSAVAVCAVLESLLSWHPYANFLASSPGYQYWGAIQVRSGVERSEWAFGHSIALSGSLALSIPFVLTCTFRPAAKVFMMIAIMSGTFVSLSRGGITAALLTALLCYLAYLSLRRSRVAMGLLTCAVALGLILLPGRISQFVFGLTSETQQSAAYRGQLYDLLLPRLSAFGPSDYITGSRYESVDSAFLYVGMNFGWLLLVLAVLPLIVIAIRTLMGNASLIEVGILGQIPLLLTVALITQYQSFLFFVIGIACYPNLFPRADRPQAREPESLASSHVKHPQSADR